MFRRVKDLVDEQIHIRANRRCPAPVIVSVLIVHFLIEAMFLRHIGIICDVLWKSLIRSWVRADQAIILVADSYLCHRRLQNHRLVIVGIQYRIVVAIIWQMIVGRNGIKRYIVAEREGSVGKSLHVRLVVEFKCLLPGIFPSFGLSVIDVRYYLSAGLIGRFKAVLNILLELFNQPRFEILNVLLNRRLSFGLVDGRR